MTYYVIGFKSHGMLNRAHYYNDIYQSTKYIELNEARMIPRL